MSSRNDLNAVRAATDIVELVSAYVPLKPCGARLKGLCPFHTEDTPSFYVHPAKRFFKCFGCGAGGDVFAFLSRAEGIDFKSAVERLANRAGITPTARHRNAPIEVRVRPPEPAPVELPEDGPVDWDYEQRTCLDAMSGEATAELAARLGVSWLSIERLRAGIYQYPAGGWAWSFPMRDAQGKVIGLRLRNPETVRKLAVKGSRGGLFQPRGLGSAGPLLICEGPTSLAALLDWGFDAIGRDSAWGAHDLVCEFCRRWRIPSAVLVADNDKPDRVGRKAGPDSAEALARKLSLIVPSVRVLLVPVVKDARDWLKAGAGRADVEAAIAAAPDFSLQPVVSVAAEKRGRR